jgi:hypothetical protein
MEMTMRFSLILLGLAAGCGPSHGNGSVQVFLAAEDTIPDGLEPGSGEENIMDGWKVTYDKFLLTFGNFRAARASEPELALSEPRVLVVDMKALPTGGFVFAHFTDAAAVRYDKVGFDLPNASSAAKKADITSQADYAMMVSGGYSVYVEATLHKPGGQSCRPTLPTDCVARETVTVKWGVKAGTAFDDCAPPMGDAGFAVPAGGSVQVKPTIHGDHWFFTNITQGAEMTERLAQWIADADLDRNGATTLDELKMVKSSDVFKPPTYNISGALVPVMTAYDYLVAQASTLGDYQGEGECPTRKRL